MKLRGSGTGKVVTPLLGVAVGRDMGVLAAGVALATSCRRRDSTSCRRRSWSSTNIAICRAMDVVASLLAPAWILASASSSCAAASAIPASVYRNWSLSLSSRLWFAAASNDAISSELMLSSARRLSSSDSRSFTAVCRRDSCSSSLFRSPVRWERSSSTLAAFLSRFLWSSSIVVDFLIESLVTFSSLSVIVLMVPSLFVSSAN